MHMHFLYTPFLYIDRFVSMYQIPCFCDMIFFCFLWLSSPVLLLTGGPRFQFLCSLVAWCLMTEYLPAAHLDTYHDDYAAVAAPWVRYYSLPTRALVNREQKIINHAPSQEQHSSLVGADTLSSFWHRRKNVVSPGGSWNLTTLATGRAILTYIYYVGVIS